MNEESAIRNRVLKLERDRYKSEKKMQIMKLNLETIDEINDFKNVHLNELRNRNSY